MEILFGKILKKKREEKSLTQQQMADFLKLKLRQYQRFESGDTLPTVEYIVLISKELKYDFLGHIAREGGVVNSEPSEENVQSLKSLSDANLIWANAHIRLVAMLELSMKRAEGKANSNDGIDGETVVQLLAHVASHGRFQSEQEALQSIGRRLKSMSQRTGIEIQEKEFENAQTRNGSSNVD